MEPVLLWPVHYNSQANSLAKVDADLVVGPRLGAVGRPQPPHAVQSPHHAERRAETGTGQRPSVAVREDHDVIARLPALGSWDWNRSHNFLL